MKPSETAGATQDSGTGKEAQQIKLDPISSASQVRKWWLDTTEKVASASSSPDEAFEWVAKVKTGS